MRLPFSPITTTIFTISLKFLLLLLLLHIFHSITTIASTTSCVGSGNRKIDQLCSTIHNYFSGADSTAGALPFSPRFLKDSLVNSSFFLPLSLLEAQREVVASIVEHDLVVQLPGRRIPLRHPFSHLVLAKDPLHAAIVFAFQRKGLRIVLHDHPQFYGFIKAVRGSIAVSSYSWLDPAEELALVKRKMEEEGDGKAERSAASALVDHQHCPARRPARYEGREILSELYPPPPPLSSSSSLSPPFGGVGVGAIHSFEPARSNLHLVDALDDGAVFFALHLFKPLAMAVGGDDDDGGGGGDGGDGHPDADELAEGRMRAKFFEPDLLLGVNDPTGSSLAVAPVVGEVYWLDVVPAPQHMIIEPLELSPSSSS